MRKRIFEIIEIDADNDTVSHIYDVFMIVMIILSIIPLAMKNPSWAWRDVENICIGIFIVDYFLRLLTADYKLGERDMASFVRYPFTPMAIIDLVSILPHFIVLNSGFGLLRLIRLARALRVFRIFKIFRYSSNVEIILSVIRRSKDSLVAVGTMTVAYILTSALIVLNVEPETFESFFDAVYWATVSLTTIGYGDITPTSTIGRVVTMCSAFFGIAVIALPASIITAGYMEEIQERRIANKRSRRRKKDDSNDFHVRD